MPRVATHGIELAVESFGRESDPALPRVMGLGAQMILWDEAFCEALAARGFRVIRFDNRDVGLSTRLTSAGMPNVMAAMAAAATGQPVPAAYTLSDMADDTAGLLDALGIAAAHVVGASMGGMIAQTLAIRDPKRVRTLASGNRKAALANVRIPALVIHGDADPLVPIAGGRDTAEAIPGCELLVIEGMSHDLPPRAWPGSVDAIAKHTARAA
jgi:pimeloyl-ACP methyl ester carboxylesterase